MRSNKIIIKINNNGNKRNPRKQSLIFTKLTSKFLSIQFDSIPLNPFYLLNLKDRKASTAIAYSISCEEKIKKSWKINLSTRTRSDEAETRDVSRSDVGEWDKMVSFWIMEKLWNKCNWRILLQYKKNRLPWRLKFFIFMMHVIYLQSLYYL